VGPGRNMGTPPFNRIHPSKATLFTDLIAC
jgi:hypothetical protein